MQYNLFLPVFELFRKISVGDNLVSSAILEVRLPASSIQRECGSFDLLSNHSLQICDFIRTENIKSLVEYIVTKHLSIPPHDGKSLEEVANTHVDTFKQLRKKYEENTQPLGTSSTMEVEALPSTDVKSADTHDTLNGARQILNTKALEDQVSLFIVCIHNICSRYVLTHRPSTAQIS